MKRPSKMTCAPDGYDSTRKNPDPLATGIDPWAGRIPARMKMKKKNMSTRVFIFIYAHLSLFFYKYPLCLSRE
ncbi:MAG: hypothetical protein A4E39_01047 [Methanoregulaceae archaeon PtaB.Bin152]|nr:MAG: hypothetical protein A4E39_01047 [Methanoregulaceae archaeon PtaB.Bin152]